MTLLTAPPRGTPHDAAWSLAWPAGPNSEDGATAGLVLRPLRPERAENRAASVDEPGLVMTTRFAGSAACGHPRPFESAASEAMGGS